MMVIKAGGSGNLYSVNLFYYTFLVLKKVIRIILLSIILTLMPFSFQSATSAEILWNPNTGNSLANTRPGLVPGAGIRGTNLLVYKENPDELIMRIIMNESFEDKPFSGKGRNIAMWIYWPTDYCWNENKPDCTGLMTVSIPNNPATYPNSKSTESVTVVRHNKKSNVDRTVTNCNAPWWIESTFKSRDTWTFALSITCLGIPKEFGWYGYSSIDVGQTDVVTEFTQVQTIIYPFWDLAAKSAKTTDSVIEDKDAAITSYSKIVSSTKQQANALKSLLSKSKTISISKKNSYQKTLKEFDNYAKLSNIQTQELNNKGVNFDLVIKTYIQEWSVWNKKLKDIINSINKK